MIKKIKGIGIILILALSLIIGATRGDGVDLESSTEASSTIKNSESYIENVLQNQQDVSNQPQNSTNEIQEESTESVIKQSENKLEENARAPSSNSIKEKNMKISVINNIVKNIVMTDGQGNIISTIGKNDTVSVNFDFELPNNVVKSGDVSIIKLPSELRLISDDDFNITDSTNNIVAKAHIDRTNKTVTLAYTDYVETYSNIKGTFFVATRIDTEIVTHEKNIIFNFIIDGKSIEGGRGHYSGKGDSITDRFNKVSRFDQGNSRFIQYQVRINPFDKSYKNVLIKDNLQSESLSYDKTSFKIEKGTWRLDSKGRLYLGGKIDITNQFKIHFTNNDRGWEVPLGDIIKGDGYAVTYYGVVNHELKKGETFTNQAEMYSNENQIDLTKRQTVYQTSGGSGEGEVFSIHLLKKSETGKPLKNAKFEVTRVSSNTVIGTYNSDTRGIVNIDKLLKDSYIIKEIEAPQGYELLNEPILVTFDEFGTNKEVQKDVINKKLEKTIKINGQKTWNDKDNQDGKRPEKI
ncbi:Ig-like domain-containing protein, partial [Enterococcus faecalis]|uniref:Ig-like domain-containing protein n=1 Tax=Enterococcus faecalis TaxID=1351 RepID=UPI001EF9D9D5